MSKYSSGIINSFFFTEYAGTIKNASVVSKFEREECADVVKLYLSVKNSKIEKCTFQALGSVVLFATLSAVCKLVTNKSLEEAEKVSEKDVIKELGELNKQNFSTVVFALSSLRKTIETYRKKLQNGKINENATATVKLGSPAKGIKKFEQKTSVITLNEETETTNSNSKLESESTDSEKEDSAISAKATKEKKEQKKTTPAKRVVIETKEEAKESASKSAKTAATSTTTTTKQVKKVVINKASATKTESAAEKKAEVKDENPELLVKPVSSKKSKGKRVAIPQKETPKEIDVTVVEGEEQAKPVTTTTKTTTKVVAKKHHVVNTAENNNTANGGNNVVLSSKDFREIQNPENTDSTDELDTITAKLTSAISELNFKFDDTDNN